MPGWLSMRVGDIHLIAGTQDASGVLQTAGFSTRDDADTLVMMWIGCQPSSAAFLMACAANFGVPMLTKISGFEVLIATTWESTVGMLVSYEISLTTILPYLSRSTSFSPST